MKKKLGLCFDFSGVFATTSNVLSSTSEAISLLRHYSLPYVVLTNAGGRLDSDRAALMS